MNQLTMQINKQENQTNKLWRGLARLKTGNPRGVELPTMNYDGLYGEALTKGVLFQVGGI